jgi:hypothetical protein
MNTVGGVFPAEERAGELADHRGTRDASPMADTVAGVSVVSAQIYYRVDEPDSAPWTPRPGPDVPWDRVAAGVARFWGGQRRVAP